MTLGEMEQMMLEHCRQIDRGIAAMVNAGERLSVAEHRYREARRKAWEKAKGENVSQREAWVDAETADYRLERDRAENERKSAVEAVRARQGQLSALQTLMTAHRAEAEFVRTGP